MFFKEVRPMIKASASCALQKWQFLQKSCHEISFVGPGLQAHAAGRRSHTNNKQGDFKFAKAKASPPVAFPFLRIIFMTLFSPALVIFPSIFWF